MLLKVLNSTEIKPKTLVSVELFRARVKHSMCPYYEGILSN